MLNSLSAASHSCCQSKNFLSVAMIQYHDSPHIHRKVRLHGDKTCMPLEYMCSESMEVVDGKFNVKNDAEIN